MSKINENESIQTKTKNVNEIISMCNQNIKKNEKNNIRQSSNPNKLGLQKNTFINEQKQNLLLSKNTCGQHSNDPFSNNNFQNTNISKTTIIKKSNNNKGINKSENVNPVQKNNNYSNNLENKDSNNVFNRIKQINQIEEKIKPNTASNNKNNINENINNNAIKSNVNFNSENISKSKGSELTNKNQINDFKNIQESKNTVKCENFKDKLQLFAGKATNKESINKNEPKKQFIVIKKEISNPNTLNNNTNKPTIKKTTNISSTNNDYNINNTIKNNINNDTKINIIPQNTNTNNITNNVNSSEANKNFNEKLNMFNVKKDNSESNNNISKNQIKDLKKRNSSEIFESTKINDSPETEKKDVDLILKNLMESKNIPKRLERSNTIQINDVKIQDSKIHNSINYSSINRKLKNKNKNENDEDIIILEQVTLDEKFLNPKNNILQNFCESFFLASFPAQKGKIIENSLQFKADCNHRFCECFPAIQSEILYKFPIKDSGGLEINNLAASICFPNGIKVCFEEIESRVSTLQNYSSCFTSQNGDKYFSMIYRFYLKMSNNEYYEKYIPDLIKEKIEKRNENSDDPNFENYNILYEKLQNNKNNVYIPYCMCLVSKYPLITQMEKCLQSIFLSMNNPEIKIEEIYKLIAYIIKGIPAPILYSKITFPIPNCSDLIEIIPTFYQELSINGDNPTKLLDISTTNIILIFRLLLFEQRILLISKHYESLSSITYNFISLLYPFTWVHTYIPIMTEKMLKYLQSFLPFFNGMHKDLFQLNTVQNLIYKAQKGLFIFDVDDNIIELNVKKGKKKKNAMKYINKNIPSLPKQLENMLTEQINIIKKTDFKNQYINNIQVSDIRMKNLFILFFAEILFDYKKYLNIIDDFPVFNSVSLIDERKQREKEKEKDFYQEVTSSQLFQMFIQNSLNYINLDNSSTSNNIEPSFFDEKIKEIQEIKKENENFIIVINKEFDNSLLKYYDIKTNYVIPPDAMSFFKENKKKEKNILSRYKRILSNPINLQNEYNITNCIYYPLSKEKYEIMLNSVNQKDLENKKTNEKNHKKTKFITTKDTNEKSENCLNQKESVLSEDDKEDIKDSIRDILTRIFKSGKIDTKQDQKILLKSMESEFGKDYFINTIYPKKNKTEKMNTINEDSFNLLEKVICNTITSIQKNEDSKQSLKNIMDTEKLLKICLYFRTVNNKKEEKILSQNIYGQLNKSTIINKNIFWEIWVENELSDEDHETFKNIKRINNDKENYHYINEDDENIKNFRQNFYCNLENINKIMIEMKMSKGTILEILSELCKDYVNDENKMKQLLKPMQEELLMSVKK